MSRLHLQPRAGKPKDGRHILGWAGHARVTMAKRRRANAIAKASRKRNR